ncbi:hypothetical protein [Burkholderia sp. Tr-20390]|nr:hypothetical protein [Burkholderia sp. Tr-20390]
MANLVRIRARPVFHRNDLLVEVLDDHRKRLAKAVSRSARSACMIPG